MLEDKLAATLKEIFVVKKVSYDAPDPEAIEQGTLFVEIEESLNSIKDGKALAIVTGSAVMVCPADQLPIGFFSKAIKQADPKLTKDLFFYEIEGNSRRFQNIVQRGFSFKYFFSSQYDPDLGSMNEVKITVEEH